MVRRERVAVIVTNACVSSAYGVVGVSSPPLPTMVGQIDVSTAQGSKTNMSSPRGMACIDASKAARSTVFRVGRDLLLGEEGVEGAFLRGKNGVERSSLVGDEGVRDGTKEPAWLEPFKSLLLWIVSPDHSECKRLAISSSSCMRALYSSTETAVS